MTRIEKGKATPLRRPGRQPKGGLQVALPPGVPEMIEDARRGEVAGLAWRDVDVRSRLEEASARIAPKTQ